MVSIAKVAQSTDTDDINESVETSSDYISPKEVARLLPWMSERVIKCKAGLIDPDFKRNPGPRGRYKFHRTAVIAYRDRGNGGKAE